MPRGPRLPGQGLRFRDEMRDFLRFVRRPRLGPRLPGPLREAGWLGDWTSGLRLGHLLAWAACLLGVNMFALGPLALAAAGAGGAAHRLDVDVLPWLQALLWAPLVEELVFRYGLRRPLHALWMVPLLIPVLLTGPADWSVAVLLGLLLLMSLPVWQRRHSCRLRWKWRRRYRRLFPYLFHLSVIGFATLHLANYNLNHMAWWLMPLLVLPQWLTGLVLGWQRVRHGIGASVTLHALFNAGPLLLAWVVITLLAGD